MQPNSFLFSRLYALILVLPSLFLLNACGDTQTTEQASVVRIINEDGKYSLSVNDAPYQVRGVGLGFKNIEKVEALKAAGGNTFRTWGMGHIDQELAIAAELDLMIAVGIETGKELLGYDYNDEAAVAKQFKEVTAAIEKYKNHPNVLMWVINNEPNLLFDDAGKLKDVNPKVYAAMGDIIDYIHENDPNHPATFTLAGANPEHIKQVVKYAPNIDIISVQTYGDLATLPQSIALSNIDKPYMVTEFGPVGHWELPTTAWNREIEEPSAVKAAGMAKRMQDVILDDQTGKIIGSFAFFWGQKQERTPTWYGMFNESGEHTARIDELTKMWTGAYPANRAPLSSAITINNTAAVDNIYLKPGQAATVKVMVTDPDGDTLTHDWILMGEVGTRSQGGHFEAKPAEIPLEVVTTYMHTGYVEMTFTAPLEAGEYRLFNYAYDGNNNVGNANIPFMVKN